MLKCILIVVWLIPAPASTPPVVHHAVTMQEFDSFPACKLAIEHLKRTAPNAVAHCSPKI